MAIRAMLGEPVGATDTSEPGLPLQADNPVSSFKAGLYELHGQREGGIHDAHLRLWLVPFSVNEVSEGHEVVHGAHLCLEVRFENLLDFADVPLNVTANFVDRRDDSSSTGAWFEPPSRREFDERAFHEGIDALARSWVEFVFFDVPTSARGTQESSSLSSVSSGRMSSWSTRPDHLVSLRSSPLALANAWPMTSR